eukprot:TRINITY_DN8545_c0_g1_i3.p1 TRINITY_DN8545_c0_g1~~TRINITY_DN8545_c0_g1_i3.p1  ORF type:complete len:350 (+),score=71.48 TRINITY_DN8545_c0_g1_i3:136-1050(+)
MSNTINCNSIINPSIEQIDNFHSHDIFRICHEGATRFGDMRTGNWALKSTQLEPIPLDIPNKKILYFEISIEGPLGTADGVGIGLILKGAEVGNYMPGWVRGSFAMHSDDGNIYFNNGSGIFQCKSIAYGPPFHSIGKTVGCGFNFTTQEIFFTHEGQFIDVAFTLPQQVPPGSISPCVGTSTVPATVSINLGSQPFKFNIDAYICSKDVEVLEGFVPVDITSSFTILRQEWVDLKQQGKNILLPFQIPEQEAIPSQPPQNSPTPHLPHHVQKPPKPQPPHEDEHHVPHSQKPHHPKHEKCCLL